MEPLEPTPVSGNKSLNSSKNQFQASNSQEQTNDWSDDWASSFEPTAKPVVNLSTKKAPGQLHPASSYNWSNQSTKEQPSTKLQNEEDLFSSLVKDVSLSSNKNGKSSRNNTDGWGDDWSTVQDNGEKKSNVSKARKSKPLKLGQKKDLFNFD